MDNIEVNVDFLINNPELKAASEQAKATISGVGVSAEQVAAKVAANTEKVVSVNAKRSIESLQNSIKNMQGFAVSTTNETAIVNSNKKIQDMQAEVKRLTNLGKEGFDELGNKIVEVGTKANKTTGFLNKIWSSLRTVAMVLPGIGLAGLSGFAIEPLLKWLATLDMFKPKLDAVTLASKQTQEALGGGGEYAKVVTSMKELELHIDLVKQSKYSSIAVISEYNKSLGEVTGQVKTLDEVEAGLAKNSENFIQMTLNKAIAQQIFAESGRKLAEAEIEKHKTDEETLNYFQRFGRFMDSQSWIPKPADALDWKKVAAEKRGERIKDLQDESKKLDDLGKIYTQKTADITKSMGGLLGSDKSKPLLIDKGIAAAENLQRRVYEMQAEFTRKSKTKDEEELQALRDRFTKIFEEVEKFNKNPRNKIKVDGTGLLATRNNAIDDLTYRQETEKMKIGFEEQKKIYADYEDYKKVFGEERAKARYENELNLSKTFAENVQDEYDKLANKTTLTGSETERMTALKKVLMEAKLTQLKIDDSAFKLALEASQSYFDKLVEIENTYNKNRASLLKNGSLTTDRQNELDEAKDKAIEAAKDEALQKTAIYRKLSVELLDYTKRQVIEQIAEVRKVLDGEQNLPAEIRSKLEKDLQDLEIKLKVGVEQSNLDALKLRFRELTQELGSTDSMGNSIVSEKERRRIIAALAEIQTKIKAIDGNGNGKVSWGDKVAKQFEYLKGDAGEVAKGLEQRLGRLASGFDSVAQSVGGMNTGLGQALIALGSMTKLASGLAGAVSAFDAGDLMGGITGAMGVVSFIIGGIQAMDAAYENFYQNAINGERKYQEILEERAILNAKNDDIQYKAALKEINIRKEQIEGFKKEGKEILEQLQGMSYTSEIIKSTFLGLFTMSTTRILSPLKGKSFEELQKLLLEGKLSGETEDLVKRLVDLEKKGFDAQQALKDLAKQIAELFTGTTSDSLTNSLVQMFQEGKTSAQDFADFFEKTMSDAALNIFKNKVLAEAMDKFYKEFAAEVSDGNLTADEIKDLKALFEGLISGANTQFEALKQITGLNELGSASSSANSGGNSISGVIQRSITEQTGSELLGLFRATYDLQKRTLSTSDTSLSVMREGLLAQQAIVANTSNTVKQLEIAVAELKGIGRRTFQTAVGYDRGF